ncbi:HET-domain-containing protein [Xylariaceae sp. FL1651]|nr:HET-domain-containing protein [Xylariaceae sp. FL1651]
MAMAEDLRIEFCWNTTEEATWDGRRPGDARLLCNMVSTVAQNYNKHTQETVFRFQLYYLPLGPIEKGNTRSSRPLALQWMSECRANANGEHSACRVGDASWYPTRLLDLSALEETGKVFLVVTEILGHSLLCGEYITLSHCWGTWGTQALPVLTGSNIDARVNHGMELSKFPPTFKDAIEVAGWFNIKWLWIDSLCIIQDSREDWQREAPTMCDVYRNAMLNISANHAVDARDGCFRDRYFATVDAFKLRLKPLLSTWWVSVDERNLFEWVKDAPSSQRAWIYQERHLARRVLHFTEEEVFWECRAAAPSFRSETYPRGSPLRRDFLGQTKLGLQDRSTGSISDNPHLMLEWDDACRGYSRRKLTYQANKLPALSGLPATLGPGLPRALLWDVPTRERPRGRPAPTESGAPSWSWMSCTAPVNPSTLENWYYIADVVTILADIQHKTNDQYGEIAKAHLHVYGFMRRITSVMKEIIYDPSSDAYRGLSQLEFSRKFRHLYVDGQLDRNIAQGPLGDQEFGEMPDWFHGFAPVEYHCLFLAVAQKGPRDDRALLGLLLEPAGPEGTFRRVGHVFFRGRCALKMRYRLQPGETDEDAAWEPDGPMTLYEFDGSLADDASFEKLEPNFITLI